MIYNFKIFLGIFFLIFLSIKDVKSFEKVTKISHGDVEASGKVTKVAGGDVKTPMGFTKLVGGKLSYGSTSSNDKAFVSERGSLVAGADFSIGIKRKNFFLGIGGECNYWHQLKKSTDADGKNISGTQINGSIAIGYLFDNYEPMKNYQIIGKYHLASIFMTTEKSASAKSVNYLKPNKPYSIQILKHISPTNYFGVDYTTLKYTKIKVNENTSSLNDNNKLSYDSVGVIYGFIF